MKEAAKFHKKQVPLFVTNDLLTLARLARSFRFQFGSFVEADSDVVADGRINFSPGRIILAETFPRPILKHLLHPSLI